MGEVSEPPGSQGPIYRRIGARIAQIASKAIFTGGNYQRYASGAARAGLTTEGFINVNRDTLKAAEILKKELREGDLVLIKGRDTQRLDRIALALEGRSVKCNISFCRAEVRCMLCPMLERGWNTAKVVI